MSTMLTALAIRDARAVLWPSTLDWFATVTNAGDGTAPPTTVRVLHGARELDTKAIPRELAAGATWPMSDAFGQNRPPVGAQVRICVDAVPGESNTANNCARATVERN